MCCQAVKQRLHQVGASGHPTYSLRLRGPTARSLGVQIVGSRSGYRPGTDLFSCILARVNETALKKPKSAFFRSCWPVLEGHARALLVFGWLRGKRALHTGLPSTQGEMQTKGIANGVSQILQNFGFLSKHEKGKAQENTQLWGGQEASTHINQPLP